MIAHYLRKISGKKRHRILNLRLARYLTFVAGAINAGGFLAVKQYTSHMSGIVASIGDNLAIGQIQLVLASFVALLSFASGAAFTAIVVNWGRRARIQSQYALPLIAEAVLLIFFGIIAANTSKTTEEFVTVTIVLLCFLMGLQNALITKLSNTEIRTTHVTGMVTDLGIELGKLFYWNAKETSLQEGFVNASKAKMQTLSSLIFLFLIGGVIGAIGFKVVGFLFTLPLALLLFTLAIVPVWDDLRSRHLAI